MSGYDHDGPQPPAQTRLRGRLGLTSIVFMVVAGAAPLTVVGGPVPLAFAYGNGAGVPTMFVLTGIVLVLFAVGFTAMSRFVPSAGGFYSYAFIGLGRRLGIGTGYAALLSYFTLYVGVYGLLGPAIDSVVTSFGGPHLAWWLWSLIALTVVSAVGYLNIEFSGKILGILLAAEVLVVVALDTAVTFSNAHGRGLSTGLLDPTVVLSGAPGVAFLFAILGFIGFEATVVFRDEARDPDRTLPRATYVAVVFIAVFYSVTSWAMLSGGGERAVVSASADAPDQVLPSLGTEYLGDLGSDLIRVLFVTSIFACVLTFHNVVARYAFSLANRELLPSALATVHPRFGSPHVAGVQVGMASLAVIALGVVARLDPIAEFYTWLVALSSLGYVMLLVVTTLAVLAFFQRRRPVALNWWTTTGAPASALMGLLATLVLILLNIMVLVGNNMAAAVAVIVLIVLAFALGPIVGAIRPHAGWEVEASPAPPDESTAAVATRAP